MRIESGPTLDQRIRLAVFLLMCILMGGYFLYDGYIGYPNENLDKVRQSVSQDLSEEQRRALEFDPDIKLEELQRVEADWKASRNQAEPMTLEDLRKRLGDPKPVLPRCYHYEGRDIIAHFFLDDEGKVIRVVTETPNPEHNRESIIQQRVTKTLVGLVPEGATLAELRDKLGDPHRAVNKIVWYIGPASSGRFIISQDGSVQEASVAVGAKSPNDLLLQKVLGQGLLLVSIYVCFRLRRLIRLRVVVDDEGLDFSGRRITWDQMVGLNTEKWDRKGWVDLVYVENGAERWRRLDSFHIKNFDPICEAICERKGWESPIEEKPEEDDQAASGEGEDGAKEGDDAS